MKKILIIEDEHALQHALQTYLEDEGFAVEEALDGEEGLRKIADHTPDLVILDLLMPRVDGFAVLEQLRAHNGPDTCPAFPILVLTNLNHPRDMGRVHDLLGDCDNCHIKTDIRLAEVTEIVHTLLEKLEEKRLREQEI